MSADAAFREAFALHLRRRRLAVGLEGGRRGGRRALAAGVLLLALVVLGVLPPPGGPFLTAGLFVLLLAGGAAWGAGDSLRREGSEGGLAAALDGALGGEDLVPAAAALVARNGLPGRFGTALLERAAVEVAGLPPERVGPLPRPPWRLIGIALLVAILAALLPAGGLGVLPGLGSGWGTGGRPRTGGANFGQPGQKPGGAPMAAPEERPADGKASPGKRPEPPLDPPGAAVEKPPPPAPRERVADLALAALARSYMRGERVTLAARAVGGPGAGAGIELELFVSVDGKPAAAEGVRRRLAAGDRQVWTFNLASVPGLLPALTPGTHRVAGELRDGSGRTAARAGEIEIHIESDDGSGGKGGGEKPKPKPKEPSPPPPSPGEPKPKEPSPPPPPPAAGGGEPKPKEPSPPLPPPSDFEEKVVRPLFGKGAEVEKKGKILVLDPEGNRGEAPREVPPEEALAVVRTRAEDAARREGIDPRDAEAVRRYFEALRILLEGKK